jgi:glycosyltransferase involved in cell wall biosynthesis
MKLLHVIGEFDIKAGGTYTALVSLVKMFSELGHSNTIIATGKHSGTNGLNAELFCFEKSFPEKFRKSRTARKWLCENVENYDAVVIHEIWGGIGLDAGRIAKKKGIPYHIWPHGSLDPFDLQKKKYLKKLLGKIFVNKILRNAKYICCTSEKEKEVINCLGKHNNNIITLLLPIDFCLDGQVVHPKPSLIRSELPDDAFVFLFFSRINYKKGLDLFLKAFAECLLEKKIGDNSYLLIAGTGLPEYESYIDDLISVLKLQSRVIKLGFVTGAEKLKVYKNAHVFVLPSKNENFGLAVIESLQSGTPVLISDNIYIQPELFNGVKPGWVCQHEINSLKDKIVESSKVELIDKINAKKVGEKFTTSNLLNAYKEVFN